MRTARRSRAAAARTDPGFRVAHYDLDLDYRMPSNRLAGRARIHCVATAAVSRIDLRLRGLRVTGLSLGVPGGGRFGQRGSALWVRPGGRIAAGTRFVLDVRYAGKPRPLAAGTGWLGHGHGATVVGGRDAGTTWFPSPESTPTKATYRLAVTAGPGASVLGNGELVAREAGDRGEVWVYRENVPMATGFAAVHIGSFGTVPLAGTVPATAAAPEGSQAALGRALSSHERMLASFQRWFGPYPFGGYTVVAGNTDLTAPACGQGVVVLGGNHLTDPRECERMAARALATQWFGAAATPAGLPDMWLAEGFARYAEWLWSEESGSTPLAALAGRTRRSLEAAPADLVLADPGPRHDERIGLRGALLLHEIRKGIGDERFFPLLREFATTHRFGTVAAGDFLALARARGGAPLDEMFAAWLLEPTLPPVSGQVPRDV